MSSAEGSLYGIAKQTAKGTPNVTDADFKYLLFREGAVAPNNVVLPLDMEIGGGAMPRSVVKVGVTSGGGLDFIPRPETLGTLLAGALGTAATPVEGTLADLSTYEHVFTLGTDQFVQPYYTLRGAPGAIFGEQFQDVKVASLALNMRAARFMEGAVSFIGGLPAPVSTAAWAASTKIDGGPQFLAPLGTIEVPTGTALKVMSATMMINNTIPLDEQWIIGSYSPDDFELVQRSIILQMVCKVDAATGGDFYKKMAYSASAPTAWAADILKEGQINIQAVSDQAIVSGSRPYSMKIEANGQAGNDGNVAFAVDPISLRAGSQVTMSITAMFLADPTGANEPVKITLINGKSTQY